MKYLFVWALLALMPSSGLCVEALGPRPTDATSANAHGLDILWQAKLDRASAAALENHQPMLLEFWAVWCEYCKSMDATVYSDPRIAAAMAKVQPVRVDIDAAPGTARKYDVTTTPTLILTDSYGNELFRQHGALTVDSLLQLLREIPANVSRIDELSAQVARAKDDGASLAALGHELRAGAFYVASNRYYERALRTQQARRDPGLRADVMVAMGWNDMELQQYAPASRVFEQSLRESPGRPWEPDVMLGYGRALLGQGRTAEAWHVLDALASRHPESRAAAEAARIKR